jgi:hypothetical protein
MERHLKLAAGFYRNFTSKKHSVSYKLFVTKGKSSEVVNSNNKTYFSLHLGA